MSGFQRSPFVIECGFLPGAHVRIKQIEEPARVITVKAGVGAVTYDVEYWLDGKLVSVTLWADQLEDGTKEAAP